MSLLIENAEKKDPVLLKKGLKWITLLLILGCVLWLSVLAYQKLVQQTVVETEDSVVLQRELEALYASEALPPTPLNGNSLNYGLNDSSTTGEDIDGYILFTGLLIDADQTGSNRTYMLNAENPLPEISPLLPDFISYSAFIEPADRYKPLEFFVDTMHYSVSQLAQRTINTNHSIQKFDITDGSLKGYESVQGTYVQNLAWSPSTQMLAYSRLTAEPESYADLISIDNREVVISNLSMDSNVAVISGATQPKWSPDGSVAIMIKPDGLYTYDVTKQKEEKVAAPTSGQFLTTSMIDVSKDGTHFVWTTGKAGVIAMNQVLSWKPFVYKEIGRIQTDNTEFYWPQFSPGGDYYVVQAIEARKEDGEQRQNPRFEIRPTTGRNIVRSYPIENFDFNYLFTDTWLEVLPEVAQFEQ